MAGASTEAGRLTIRFLADTDNFTRGARSVRDTMQGLFAEMKRGAEFSLGFEAVHESLHLVGEGINFAKDAMLGLNAQIEQSQLAFTVFTKSADGAKGIITDLQNVARTNPFKFDDLAQGAQRMLALGVAAKNVVPLMQDVAMSAAAVNGGTQAVQRITYALSQMVSTGTVNAREMRELAMDGVPAWELLSKAVGKTETATRDMVKQNQISAATFVQAYDAYVKSNYAELASRQAETFRGAMGIIRNNAQMAIAEAFKPLFEHVSQLAQEIAKFAKSADFQFWVGFAQQSIQNIISSLDGLIGKLAPVGDAFKKAFALAQAGDMSGAMAALESGFKKVFDGILATISGFTKSMFGAGQNTIATFAEGMVDGANNVLNGVLTAIAQMIADFFIGHSPPPQGPLRQIGEGGKNLMATFAAGMMEGITSVADVAKEAADVLNQVNVSMTLEQGRAAVQAATGNLDQMKVVSKEVAQAVAQISQAMADVDVKVAGVQLAMEKVKDAFKPAIDDAKAHIDLIEQTHQPNYERQQREMALDFQSNAIKLQRLQDPNAGGQQFDTQIQDLQNKARALQKPDYTLDNQIAALRNKAATIGVNETMPLDQEIRRIQSALVELRDGANSVSALDDKIRELQDKVNKPSKSDEMEKQMNQLISQRANAGTAEKELIDRQLAGIRGKYDVQKKADTDAQGAANAELTRLTAIRDAQKIVDDEKIRALEVQQRNLENQKAQISDRNAIEKAGIEEQIRGLEETKRQNDQNRQTQSYDLQEQISGLQQQKKLIDDGYSARLAVIDNEKQILSLQDAQDKLQKDMLELPWKQKLDEAEAGEKAALAPLQQQLEYWQNINTQLGLYKKEWGALTSELSANEGAIGKIKNEGGNNQDYTIKKTDVFTPDQQALRDRMKKAGQDAADHFAQGLTDWFTQHKDDVIAAGIGAVLGGAMFGPLGAIAGGIFAVKLVDKVKEVLAGTRNKALASPEGIGLTPTGFIEESGIQQFADTLAEALKNIVDGLKGLSDWAQAHGEATKDIILGLTAVFAGLWLVVNPAVGLGLAISALVALFVYDYETNPTFKQLIDNIVESFKNLNEWANNARDAVRSFLGLPSLNEPGKVPFIGPLPTAHTDPNDPNSPIFPSDRPELLVNADGTPVGRGAHPRPDPGFGSFDPDKGGLHASDFADAAKQVKDFGNSIVDLGKRLFRNSPAGGNIGSQKVEAGDLGGQMPQIDAFIQHIQDTLGPGSATDEAIQAYKDQITKEFSESGDAAKAVADAGETFEKNFGRNGTATKALTYFDDNGVVATDDTINDSVGDWSNTLNNFGSNTRRAVGSGSQPDQAFKNFRDTTLDGTTDSVESAFGKGQDWEQKFNNVGTVSSQTFDDGGSVIAPMNTFGTYMSTHFGEKGDFASYVTAFEGAILAVFGDPDGTLIQALKGFQTWIDTNWPAISSSLSQPFSDAETGITDFFTFLQSGINWLADHFKLPSIDAFTPPNAPAGGEGGSVGGKRHATGLFDPTMPGHWATVGEDGPEPMWVPQGSTIIPNDMAKQLGMLPGHADGYNLDAFLASLGGVLTHHAGALVDNMMASLGSPDVPGLPGAGGVLSQQISDGLKSWLSASSVERGFQRRAGAHGGGLPEFFGISFDQFMSVVGRYGESPIADPGDFQTLLDVAQEHNIDPRLFMAIMQTESGYGTAAGLLKPYFNYGGMGINDRGFSFDSGVHATDGGPEYAGYQSFRNFLEDEAGWLEQNGMSFADYQQADQGQKKNSVYQTLVDMLGGPAPTSRGALAGAGGGNNGGRYIVPLNIANPAQLITQPFGQTGFYLERAGFHDGVDFGVPIGTEVIADQGGVVIGSGESGIGYGTWVHLDHGDGIDSWMGHLSQTLVDLGEQIQQGQTVAYSGNTGVSSGPHLHWGAHDNGTSIDPLTLTYDNGGWITEPVLGVGRDSGMSYMFAKNGRPERVQTQEQAAASNAQPIVVNLNLTINATPDTDTNKIRQVVYDTVPRAIKDSIGTAGRMG